MPAVGAGGGATASTGGGGAGGGIGAGAGGGGLWHAATSANADAISIGLTNVVIAPSLCGTELGQEDSLVLAKPKEVEKAPGPNCRERAERSTTRRRVATDDEPNRCTTKIT